MALPLCQRRQFWTNFDLGLGNRWMNIRNRLAYRWELRNRAQRQQRLDSIVKRASDEVSNQISGRRPPLFMHFFYGATGINPRHLVVWYLFRTDAELAEAQSSGLTDEIANLTRSRMSLFGYPQEAVSQISVSFTTDEDIQRKTGGDYRHYFQ
jgi:hypothetical protein